MIVILASAVDVFLYSLPFCCQLTLLAPILYNFYVEYLSLVHCYLVLHVCVPCSVHGNLYFVQGFSVSFHCICSSICI
jgi:hypothetical protein